jgi:hypothetical protein
MPACKLCSYSDRAAIEQKIAARQLSMTAAAKIVGCNKASVSRHMSRCVAAKVGEVATATEQREGLNVRNQLLLSHQDLRAIFNDALQHGDRRSALKALEVELKQLELNAKITGQFSDAPQVNLLMAPEFVKLKQVIVDRLLPFPDARLALSTALDELAEESGNDE